MILRSVSVPGVAGPSEWTGRAIHRAGGWVEVTGFDRSPGVFDNFDGALSTLSADVDVEGFDGWCLCFGQNEKPQSDVSVRHHAAGEFAVEQQLGR